MSGDRGLVDRLALELRDLIAAKAASPVEVLEAHLRSEDPGTLVGALEPAAGEHRVFGAADVAISPPQGQPQNERHGAGDPRVDLSLTVVAFHCLR